MLQKIVRLALNFALVSVVRRDMIVEYEFRILGIRLGVKLYS